MTGFDSGIVLCNVQADDQDVANTWKPIRASKTARAILSPFQMKDLALAYA